MISRSLAALLLLGMCLFCGCASAPSVRSVGDFLESVPEYSRITVTEHALKLASSQGSEAPELAVFGDPINAVYIVDHILALDPNEISCKLLRFYPERLLFLLEEGDVCVRVGVKEQTSFMSGELVVFLSSANRFKGYWGWSSRTYSQDADERLNAAKLFFMEPRTRQHQAAMTYRVNANARGGSSFLVPVLPLGVQPESRRVKIEQGR